MTCPELGSNPGLSLHLHWEHRPASKRQLALGCSRWAQLRGEPDACWPDSQHAMSSDPGR